MLFSLGNLWRLGKQKQRDWFEANKSFLNLTFLSFVPPPFVVVI